MFDEFRRGVAALALPLLNSNLLKNKEKNLVNPVCNS